MKKYDHLFTVGFSVVHAEKDPTEVDLKTILAGLRNRISDILTEKNRFAFQCLETVETSKYFTLDHEPRVTESMRPYDTGSPLYKAIAGYDLCCYRCGAELDPGDDVVYCEHYGEYFCNTDCWDNENDSWREV